MTKMIEPKKLAGFRDFFAEDVYIRQYVINTFKEVFERYGYEPLETPALEYAEIFSGELGPEAEKMFYKFKDNAGREVMLKYEVMISMCRAVAENINNITLPYKRYQIQNVWRSEKPQKGRYREFTQCDADTIGDESVIWDAEFIQMGVEVLLRLGFKDFRANISNRKFLNGIVQYAGAAQEEFIPICLSIDKLPKIGIARVEEELVNLRKVSPKVAEKVLELITMNGETEELIKISKQKLAKIPVGMEGLIELEQIFNYLKASGVDEKNYFFAPFIARGLAYYTGPVYEFEVLEGGVGSVEGGGRYDNTIGRFVGQKIPATGGSFGIERIVEIIKDRQMIVTQKTPTKALVTVFNPGLFDKSLAVANSLRMKNINTMLYSGSNKNLDKQLKYADQKGIPFVVIIGPEEAAKNLVTIKNLRTKEQKTVAADDAVDEII